MDYAYGIPLAIANLSPSLSPMQRLLNATPASRHSCAAIADLLPGKARDRREADPNTTCLVDQI